MRLSPRPSSHRPHTSPHDGGNAGFHARHTRGGILPPAVPPSHPSPPHVHALQNNPCVTVNNDDGGNAGCPGASGMPRPTTPLSRHPARSRRIQDPCTVRDAARTVGTFHPAHYRTHRVRFPRTSHRPTRPPPSPPHVHVLRQRRRRGQRGMAGVGSRGHAVTQPPP